MRHSDLPHVVNGTWPLDGCSGCDALLRQPTIPDDWGRQPPWLWTWIED